MSEISTVSTVTAVQGETSPLIQVRGLEKWFGDYHALQAINLDVREGERIVICGPSGSGKSTLIRTLCRLEKADGGSVLFDGVELAQGQIPKVKEVLHRIGMVFQHFNLFPHLTVMHNCMLAPMSVLGIARQDAKDRAEQLLDRVRMLPYAHKYPTQLSGGQRQRVAIARALCMQPKVMLFDEPTSALDPQMVREVLEVMIELAESGMTMLCVAHEMRFARRVSQRVLFMEEGCILEDTGTDQFFSSPDSERAQSFLSKIKH